MEEEEEDEQQVPFASFNVFVTKPVNFIYLISFSFFN